MAKINISLPDNFLDELDTLGADLHMNRSRLVREAVVAYRSKIVEQKREEERRRRILQAMHVQNALRKKGGAWDGVKEIRTWRERR